MNGPGTSAASCSLPNPVLRLSRVDSPRPEATKIVATDEIDRSLLRLSGHKHVG